MFTFASPFRATFLFAALAAALVSADSPSHDHVGRRRHNFGLAERSVEKRFDDTRFTYFAVGQNACGSFDQDSDFVSLGSRFERFNAYISSSSLPQIVALNTHVRDLRRSSCIDQRY